MASIKTAISLPAELMRSVDAAAAARGETRSGFIRRVLQAAVRARRDAAITRRLNEVFADEAMVDEQRQVAEQLEEAGLDWADESW
jgi:metal-responsive CopG/Arc/MetJ family transcriptional regulator